ncbi:protein kinase domain-containing protein [Cohnella yongneupensis]|uniref:non-specific serine/threonine protein kinase n=1 Tax=Cohnella yongneupensis TaxID=425006 RepID=A0ABW0R5C2_9BACL
MYQVIKMESDNGISKEIPIAMTSTWSVALTEFINLILEQKKKRIKNEKILRTCYILKDGMTLDNIDFTIVENTVIAVRQDENIVNINTEELHFNLINRKIRGLLGSGANGVVLECEDPTLQVSLALKLWLQIDDEDKPLYEVRKQTVAGETNPNVVKVRYASKLNDYLFAEFDLIEGKTLEKWLRKKPPLRTRLRVGKKIITTLDQIHDQNIYHGDLHLDNVIVTPDENIKILDFGTSRTNTREFKELSDTRAAWLLTQTISKLLPEIHEYEDLISDPAIRYFLRVTEWTKVRKYHYTDGNKTSADYVNASLDFIIEFLWADAFLFNSGANDVPLLFDLSGLLIKSPFIDIMKLLAYFIEHCSEKSIKVFFSGLFQHSYFNESDELGIEIEDFFDEINQKIVVDMNEFDPITYYNFLMQLFSDDKEGYKKWRKIIGQMIKKRKGVVSLVM